MNKIVLIVFIAELLIWKSEATYSDYPDHPHHQHHPHHPHGPRPCDDCVYPCVDHNEPKIQNKYYTAWETQDITDLTVLTCTPDSYFSSVVYDGSVYPQNTTCYGIERNTYYDWDNQVYTGVDCHSGKRENLYGRPYTITLTSNNGNVQRLEQATLQNCECDGDTLVAFADYVAGPDALTGCCSEKTLDVNSLTAVSYKLKIWGKCCSTCYLQKAQITYPDDINNLEV